jgi:hypothetical protein
MLVREKTDNKSIFVGGDSIDTVLTTGEAKCAYFINRFVSKTKNEKVLYVHIPYCLSKCKYCNCQSKIPSSSQEVSDFITTVLATQMACYHDIFCQVRFDQVYFGGGTPTLLSAPQLESIFSMIPNFDEIPKKSIEVSPATLLTEHVELFQRYAFSFLSVGVQSIDKQECAKWNRPYVSPSELAEIAAYLRISSLYFNFDLICFLGKGDIRDLIDFSHNLDFIMNRCTPSSITIHQLYQSHFTAERTLELIKVLRNLLSHHPNYICANSMLQDEDKYLDTLHQVEYRLVTGNVNFTHYMWNKYTGMPVKGFDILSVGYSEYFHTISNVGDLLYSPGESKLKFISFDNFIYDDYYRIRREKGLPL